MEYIESLLEEYFDLSQELDTSGGPESNPNLYDEIQGIEEEICWECSLPVSLRNRELFRFIGKTESKQTYIEKSLETLILAKTKYRFQSKASVIALFRAA